MEVRLVFKKRRSLFLSAQTKGLRKRNLQTRTFFRALGPPAGEFKEQGAAKKKPPDAQLLQGVGDRKP